MTSIKTFRLGVLLPFLGAAVFFLLLDATSTELMRSSKLDFGTSVNLPTPGFSRYLAFWMFYGTLAACCLTFGLARWIGGGNNSSRLAEAWNQASDRKWILYSSLFALLIPAALRTYLLNGTPLTDDESAYRFMAQVLATGSVYADSPPLKLFFDNRFMINDGKFFAHFFIGWPALLVPGVWLGIPGFMNAIYSALTLPALFAVLRRLVGSAWAKAGAILYLSSPMLMIAAATETSHTSCIAALAWVTWFCLRSRDEDAPWWVHAAVAVTFCIAFFIRPISALGIGLPLLVWWLGGLRRRSRLRALATFALPTLAVAALFLGVNKLQTGDFFEVAYQRAFTYAEENGFRFSLWPEDHDGDAQSELAFQGLGPSLAVLATALFRLNVSFLGWPCSLLFALFAGQGRLRGALKLSLLSFFALHFLSTNVGIDTFAPMHYFELAWPLLLLNLCGLESMTKSLSGTIGWGAGVRGTGRRRTPGLGAVGQNTIGQSPVGRNTAGKLQNATPTVWPTAAMSALILTNLISFTPVRFTAISKVANNIAIPQTALAEADIGRSVIFVREPFIRYCRSGPTHGWVFSRPNNDPKLENSVLWVNHLSLEKNRLLMGRFPDRQGYVMAWNRDCQIVFLPLDKLTPGMVPDAPIKGIAKVGES